MFGSLGLYLIRTDQLELGTFLLGSAGSFRQLGHLFSSVGLLADNLARRRLRRLSLGDHVLGEHLLVLLPGTILLPELVLGGSSADGRELPFILDAQHRAGLQVIDIFLEEGIGVVVEQRHHHLIDTDGTVTPDPLRNRPQGITALDGVGKGCRLFGRFRGNGHFAHLGEGLFLGRLLRLDRRCGGLGTLFPGCRRRLRLGRALFRRGRRLVDQRLIIQGGERFGLDHLRLRHLRLLGLGFTLTRRRHRFVDQRFVIQRRKRLWLDHLRFRHLRLLTADQLLTLHRGQLGSCHFGRAHRWRDRRGLDRRGLFRGFGPCHGSGGRFDDGRLLASQFGWIQQYGVFTQNPATPPTGLYQKIEIGIMDRLGSGNMDGRTPARFLHHLETEQFDGGDGLDPDPGKILLGCQLDLQGLEYRFRGGGEFYFRIKRLFQCRMQLDVPEPQGKCPHRQHRKQNQQRPYHSPHSHSPLPAQKLRIHTRIRSDLIE